MYNQNDEIITIDELCEILLIGRNTAYTLLNEEAFGEGAFRIGNRWKISRQAVNSYIQHRPK